LSCKVGDGITAVHAFERPVAEIAKPAGSTSSNRVVHAASVECASKKAPALKPGLGLNATPLG
jgi:hypothetical protein